jgi:hypothetical protein
MKRLKQATSESAKNGRQKTEVVQGANHGSIEPSA